MSIINDQISVSKATATTTAKHEKAAKNVQKHGYDRCGNIKVRMDRFAMNYVAERTVLSIGIFCPAQSPIWLLHAGRVYPICGRNLSLHTEIITYDFISTAIKIKLLASVICERLAEHGRTILSSLEHVFVRRPRHCTPWSEQILLDNNIMTLILRFIHSKCWREWHTHCTQCKRSEHRHRRRQWLGGKTSVSVEDAKFIGLALA